MKRAVLLVYLVLAAVPALAQRTRGVSRLEPPVRVLFIGNSLTSENGLPALVCRLARQARVAAICASAVEPGFAIEDHLAQGTVQRRLADDKWSFVVMQQGPSALESSRVNLRTFVGQIAPLIRASGAVPVMYAVWPTKMRSSDFPRVSESYRLAAEDVGGLFAPAGDAWLEAWRRDPSIALYGPDDFHPSRAGTYLAALVIYRTILGPIPDEFADPAVAGPGITPDELKLLVAVARGEM
jgi:hypothetical protein